MLKVLQTESSRATQDELPRLEAGDHLDQPTFHRLYEAMPPGFRAELRAQPFRFAARRIPDKTALTGLDARPTWPQRATASCAPSAGGSRSGASGGRGR